MYRNAHSLGVCRSETRGNSEGLKRGRERGEGAESAWGKNLQFSCFLNGLDSAMDVELEIDIVNMPFDRPCGEVEFAGDFRIAQAGCDELKDLDFTIAERVEKIRAGRIRRDPGFPAPNCGELAGE